MVRRSLTMKGVKMFIEKRKFPRVKLACKISMVFGERLLMFNSHTENIGELGIRVILEEKLHESTIVAIELFLKERSLKCKGQVIWVKEVKPLGISPRFFDIGIKFIEMNDSNREEIGELVKALISQEQANE